MPAHFRGALSHLPPPTLQCDPVLTTAVGYTVSFQTCQETCGSHLGKGGLASSTHSRGAAKGRPLSPCTLHSTSLPSLCRARRSLVIGFSWLTSILSECKAFWKGL